MTHRSEYKCGSILRIRLTNFVTYDSCELFPGPKLNMIIGPNGTGKSSIVCAIGLGLGGAPSVGSACNKFVNKFAKTLQLLGRAKEVSFFVKHGCEKATIEIELKGKSGPHVVARVLNRKDNSSDWCLDGLVLRSVTIAS